jgi:hypothetical protein
MSAAGRPVGSLLLRVGARRAGRVRAFATGLAVKPGQAVGRLEGDRCFVWRSDALGQRRVVRDRAARSGRRLQGRADSAALQSRRERWSSSATQCDCGQPDVFPRKSESAVQRPCVARTSCRCQRARGYSSRTEPERRRGGDEKGLRGMSLMRRRFTIVRSRMLGSLVLVAVASVIPVLTSDGAAAAAGSAHGPVSISSILSAGDIVTGVRGTTNGNVILTGGAAGGHGVETAAFSGAVSPAPPWARQYRC